MGLPFSGSEPLPLQPPSFIGTYFLISYQTKAPRYDFQMRKKLLVFCKYPISKHLDDLISWSVQSGDKKSSSSYLAIYKLLLLLVWTLLIAKILQRKRKGCCSHLLFSNYFAIYIPRWLPWTPLKRNCTIMLPEYIPSLQYKWPLRKIIPIHFTVFKVLITVSNVGGGLWWFVEDKSNGFSRQNIFIWILKILSFFNLLWKFLLSAFICNKEFTFLWVWTFCFFSALIIFVKGHSNPRTL